MCSGLYLAPCFFQKILALKSPYFLIMSRSFGWPKASPCILVLDLPDAYGILDSLSPLRASIVPPEQRESIVSNEIARFATVIFEVDIFALGCHFWRLSRSANCALRSPGWFFLVRWTSLHFPLSCCSLIFDLWVTRPFITLNNRSLSLGNLPAKSAMLFTFL